MLEAEVSVPGSLYRRAARLAEWPRGSFLLLLVVLSFLLRGGMVLALRDPFQVHRVETNWDGVMYHAIALNLVRGHGYGMSPERPTRYWMPGFPLLLAGVYGVAGERPVAVYLSLCLLGTAACLLTYFLGKQLHGEAFGRTAALLGAIYVPHIYLASVFLSENLYAVLVGAGALFAVRYLRSRRLADLAAATVTAGLGILTRPFLLVGALLFALWLTLRGKHAGLVRWAGPVYLCGVLAVLSPWVIRNYRLDGRLVVLTTGAGVTFHGANNDLVLGDIRRWGTWIPTSELPEAEPVSRIQDEWVRDRMHWRIGLRWAREHWPWEPVLAVARLLRFWLPDFDSPNRAYVALQVASYTPFLGLLLAALPALRRQAKQEGWLWVPVHAFLLASVAAAVLFWGGPRFRDGNAPLLMVYAALGAAYLLKRGRREAQTLRPGDSSSSGAGFVREPHR
jgi:hypothetical protein